MMSDKQKSDKFSRKSGIDKILDDNKIPPYIPERACSREKRIHAFLAE
jgi:hypothetical protein